jgi:RNA polymerase-binding transcription factor
MGNPIADPPVLKRTRPRPSPVWNRSAGMPQATKQNKVDIEKFRQRLLATEQELARKVERNTGKSLESSDDQPDSVDQAVVGELRDTYLALAQRDTDVLDQVRAALDRIDRGGFGRCVVDGEPIDTTRLEAVPWTPYCARHQNEAETAAGLRTPRA